MVLLKKENIIKTMTTITITIKTISTIMKKILFFGRLIARIYTILPYPTEQT